MQTDRTTLPAWGATLVILVLCLTPRAWLPHPETTPRGLHADKVVHFAMFAAFGVLWTRARGDSNLPRRAAVVFVVALALAVGTELTQASPQIDRDADPYDALADALGAAAGVAVALGGGRRISTGA